MSEFVEYLDNTREKLIEDTIDIATEKNGIPVEVALHYNTGFSENVFSYVNNINTIEGGTHLTGFKRGLTTTLKAYAESHGMLSKLKFDINSDDFREGLTAVISVKVAEPQFEGQTKTKLGNTEVGTAVSQAVSTVLENYLEENPREAKAIVDKVILAATARHAARKARDLVQRKTVLSGSGLPVNWPTVRIMIRQNVKSSWSREIQQGVRQNRDVTVVTRLFYPCGEKS